MTKLPQILALSLASALLSSCTAPAPPEPGAAQSAAGRQCFRAEQVNGFSAVDFDTVNVKVGAREMYELQIVGTCPDVDWTHRIGIRSRTGGSWVCHGYDAELIVPGPMGTQRCPVTNIRRLSEAEVLAHRQSRRRD